MKITGGPRLRRSTLVLGACLAVFGGVGMAHWYWLPVAWWIVVAAMGVLLTLRFHTVLTLCCLVLFGFGLGWWRGTVAAEALAALRGLHMQQVTIVGSVTDEAVYDKRHQLEFSLTNVRYESPIVRSLPGDITVKGFGLSMAYRGDTIRATGKFYPTRGNKVANVSFATLEVVARDDTWVHNFRRSFAAGMQSALPEPLASFALGLLIGQRTTLPEATDQQLREVGLTHIIAVSGYNLTVIVMACRRLLAPYSKFQATAACVFLISLFLAITGTSPPIVRASVISMLGIAAWYYGREIKPLVLLLVGAALTVLANPFYLWGNVSWYLSFLAFFGVLVLAPLVCRRLWGPKEPKMIGGLLVESACATVLVAPYILWIFGQTSLVGLIANMLVVPLIPLAMLLGLVAGLAGMFMPGSAGWLAWPARWLLTYMLDVANVLSRLPYAFIEDIGFSFSAMCVAYAALGFVTWVLWRKTRTLPKTHI
ncbi:MAG TPA: ComEC/Rec2 family competence protein [Candidatus Saccharimonadales bacterium]|nr:ComEC/Rec2 family competence protein [Candidatus Saccharimonadales bacterium]